MVLAAGFGSRLRPLTDLRTKSLVPVGDRPALEHLVDRLRIAQVSTIVVNAHHRAEELRAFAPSHGILLSEEAEILGTAGGVARASALLGPGDALVWNADIIAEIDVDAVAAAHAKTTAHATLVVQPRPAGEGRVGTDRRGRIVRLRSTRVADEVSGGDFLGIYVLSAALRALLPSRGCLIGDVCVPALRDGEDLRAFSCHCVWHDLGTPASYLRANLAWLQARGVSGWFGADADIAPGIRIERSIVGAGAAVAGSGALVGCVIWPGAHVTAPLADTIVTPETILTI
ncbi:MAG: sugar phosphate nucleotidyltransferase [Myxococcota bacterium]|nr:sugar phosphate nucleotidyltransferase [Myxococcota bacterium]